MQAKVRITAHAPELDANIVTYIEVNLAALRGRDDNEIELIVSQYVRDWLFSKLNVQWQFVDPNAFGLAHVPSEPRD